MQFLIHIVEFLMQNTSSCALLQCKSQSENVTFHKSEIQNPIV